MSITDDLLAHAAAVSGLPVQRLRAAASPIGGDLDAVRDLVTLAQNTGEPTQVAALLDDAIGKLVTARHNLAPGDHVRRYLPELRRGLVLMETSSDRYADQEWRRSQRYPEWFVDQHGVPCAPEALPRSLVVVEASAERRA